VRDALEEGVRAALPDVASGADCEARAQEVVRALAGGSLMHVDELHCHRSRDRVTAVAVFTLRSWLPAIVPDWHLHLRASAPVE
jgi:hypothetical protein